MSETKPARRKTAAPDAPPPATGAPMMLPLADLRPSPSNVRARLSGIEELAASLKQVGLLAPLTVRPNPAGRGWLVVDGHRRFAAAKLAGFAMVPVFPASLDDGASLTLAQTVANTMRAPMSAVEIWEAVEKLQAEGVSAVQACQALALDERTRTRMERLGRLPEKVRADLKAGKVPVPPDETLRLMVQAKPEALAQAWTANRRQLAEGSMWGLRDALRQRRFRRGAAIFNLAEHPEVTWDAELFTECDEASTADCDAFLAAQAAAVATLAARLAAAGVPAVVLNDRGPRLPENASERWGVFDYELGVPDADDEAEAFDANGQPVPVPGHAQDKPDPRDPAILPEVGRAFVIDPHTGTVHVRAYEIHRRPPQPSGIGPDGEAEAAAPAAAERQSPPITARGIALIEAAKRDAVAGALAQAIQGPLFHDAALLGVGLLLAHQTGCTRHQRSGLVLGLADPLMPDAVLRKAALASLSEITRDALCRPHTPAAMQVVEVLGAALDAQAAVSWDADALSTLRMDELQRVAERLGVTAAAKKTAKALRAAILDGQVSVTLNARTLPALAFSADGGAGRWPYLMDGDRFRAGDGEDDDLDAHDMEDDA